MVNGIKVWPARSVTHHLLACLSHHAAHHHILHSTQLHIQYNTFFNINNPQTYFSPIIAVLLTNKSSFKLSPDQWTFTGISQKL